MKNPILSSIFCGVALISSSALFADTNTVIQSYFQAWNEPQAEKRLQLLDQAVADQVSYIDPQTSLKSRAELAQYIVQTQAQISGLRAEVVGDIKKNKGSALFNWRILNGEGQLIAQGVDTVAFAKDGRLQSVNGFFDVQIK